MMKAAPTKDTPLSVMRLIYRSENAMTVTGSRLLVHYHDIVATARRNNAKAEIDGFLMFDRTWFHQILEGPENRIDTLFARIKADPRHTNIECLSRETITERYFSEWSMGSFLSATAAHPLKTRHAMQANAAVDYDTFLRFARDFVAEENAEA
jgi:Sensors of blue-light using FAD